MAITKEINVVVKETGLDEVNKKVDKLEMSVDSLEQQQRSLSKSMVDSSQSVLDNGGAMGLLNDATGGVAMTIKDAVEASVLFTKSQKASAVATSIATTVVGTSTGAMKAFRIALAATGIGLIVIGLGLLIANFDKVKKAVLNLIPGLDSVGEFFGNLVDMVTDFIGITSEAERALEKLTKQADKSLALNKKFVAEQGDILSEYTKQKIDAKNRYLEAIKEEGADQIALAKRLNRELLAIDKKREDDLAKVRKEAQDKADKIAEELRQKAKDKRDKEQQAEADRIKKLEDEKLAKQMESAQKAIDILDELKKNKETPAQKEQREYEEKKAILEQNNISTEELERQHIDTMFAINEDARIKKLEEENKFNNNLLQAEESLKNAKLDAANFTTQLITQIAGKNKAVAIAMLAVEKGLAIAQIVSSAGKSIANATANLAAVPAVIGVVPNPMYAVQAAATAKGIAATKISAGVSIASILAQSITSAKGMIASGDSGGGGSVGGGGSAPQAPSFNLVQGTGTNQIAQSISNQQPIKAFVVAKDVTTGQSMDRNIIDGASL